MGYCLPTIRVPKWHDAGKPRKLSEIESAYLKGQDDPDVEGVGWPFVDDQYHITRTDLTAAWASRRAKASREKHQTIMSGAIESLGILTPDFWRAYSRVRTARMGMHHAVTQVWSGGNVTVTAGTLAGWDGCGCTARETVALDQGIIHAQSITLCLDDDYLWPLRGVEWGACAVDGYNLLLMSPDDEHYVGIMGLRR